MKQILIELQSNSAIDQQLDFITSEWQTSAYSSLLIHIFCGLSDVSPAIEAARVVRREMPDAQIVGTMSAGEICEGRLAHRGVLVSAILADSSSIRVLRHDEIMGNEADVGDVLCRELQQVEDLRAVELIFPGISMDTLTLYEHLSQCRSDAQVFGGYSGGHELNSPQYFLFDEKEVLRDSMYVVTYAGADLHVNMDKLVGWDPLGLPFTVTKAEGNRLIEVNERPASEVYESFLQIDRTQIDNALAGYEFPLMTMHDGDKNLRSTIHIDEDGALVLHGHVPEEAQVHLSYGNPSLIIELVNDRLRALSAFDPQIIFLFSCIVRKQFWGDLVDIEMSPFAELASTVGFHTWGEVMRDMRNGEVVEHNVTLLSIAMREGGVRESRSVVPHVDSSVLHGQASLMSRLASLVNTTMRELQEAHNDLMLLNQRLTVMAERDALTGLYNRGKTEQLIHDALDETLRAGDTTALIMTDVDHFKRVNDTFGHDIGDCVLRDVAFLLGDAVTDMPDGAAGRWGGEEFFLLLPHTELQAATEVAETLRKTVERHEFVGAGHLTISLGVLSVTAEEACTDKRTSLFTSVDNALYRAKNEGRNRVVVA